MKNNRITLLLLFWILMFDVLSQDINNSNEQFPYIEVTGYAEMEVVPDEIFVGITLKERIENKQKIAIEEQEAQLKTALEKIGLDLTNLYLSDANASYVKVRWQRNEVITQKEFTLKLTTAKEVAQVFQLLDELQIKDAIIQRVSHSNIAGLRKDVRINAMKNAKEKADYLLEAIGERTGKALIINEQNNIIRHDLARMPIRQTGLKGSSISMDDLDKFKEIQFEKIKLTANIYAKFAIE